MAVSATYREIVREIAHDHYGYVTTQEAAEAGVPPGELSKLAARGGLVNVAYGVYRMSDVPSTVYDQFAEALLRVGSDACLHGESVLALLGLADVNPRWIKVAVPRRARPTLPAFIDLTRVKGGTRTILYQGIASQPVAEAILECRGRVPTERLMEAARQARGEGLLSTTEWHRVRNELRTSPTSLQSLHERSPIRW